MWHAHPVLSGLFPLTTDATFYAELNGIGAVTGGEGDGDQNFEKLSKIAVLAFQSNFFKNLMAPFDLERNETSESTIVF